MSAAHPNADVLVPLSECTPWCNSTRTGHAREHPEDRSCWSSFRQLHLSRRAPVQHGEEWVSDWFDLCLRRRPEDSDSVLVLNDETNRCELELTRDEAVQLVTQITELLALEQP